MIGLSEFDIRSIIQDQLFVVGQQDVQMKRTIDKLVDGVAKAVEANNKVIESNVNRMIDEKLRNLTRGLH